MQLIISPSHHLWSSSVRILCTHPLYSQSVLILCARVQIVDRWFELLDKLISMSGVDLDCDEASSGIGVLRAVLKLAMPIVVEAIVNVEAQPVRGCLRLVACCLCL